MNLHEITSEDSLVMDFLRLRFRDPEWTWWWHDDHPDYTTYPNQLPLHMGQTDLQIWQRRAANWDRDGRTSVYNYY